MLAEALEHIAAVARLDLIATLRTVQDEPVGIRIVGEGIPGARQAEADLLRVIQAGTRLKPGELPPVVKVEFEPLVRRGLHRITKDFALLFEFGGEGRGLGLDALVTFQIRGKGRPFSLSGVQDQVAQHHFADAAFPQPIDDIVRTFALEGLDFSHEHKGLQTHDSTPLK